MSVGPKEDERLTQFLLALAERIPEPDPKENAGKSLNDIFEDEGFCAVNDIRCVCGISVPSDEPLIRCSSCERQLHKRCLDLPPDSELTQVICPFCRLKVHSIDPFRDFGTWLRDVEDLGKDISLVYDKIGQLSNHYRHVQFRDTQQRNDGIEKANSHSVLDVYDRLVELRERFSNLIS